MRLIGLTGGIASGKSTVSAMFHSLGAPILDADLIAREVVEPGTPALLEIARRFPFAIDAAGRLDRKALGEAVFSRPEERAALNAIVHPRIREAFAEKTRALAQGGARLVIYDAALLFENGLDQAMDEVIVVYVPREVQLQRLMARDGLTLEQAEARLASQLSLEEKAKKAGRVVDNSEAREATWAQVERIWQSLWAPA
ncbi:MAG: dephospho-CoA kinase [Myxococcota bacterium]|nr:dephospho-CoA kinase [Myxococcota bacterium]